MILDAPATQTSPGALVEQYLDLIGPQWREHAVVLPPSHLALDEIRLEDLTLDLLPESPQTCC